MRRSKLRSNLFPVGGAAAVALVLTLVRPTPQGLGDDVRAAPGAPSSSVKRKHNLRALKIFNRTLVRVRDRYVDASRIDPKEMLYEALDSVQFNIPEVLVDPDRKNSKITITVNDKQKVFGISDVDSPWRLSKRLKEIFGFIEENMNPGADLAQVEYAAVNGMLSTLDPHSSLLDPELAAEMDVNTSGKFGGLGIIIGMRDRKLTVIRPFKNTPAAEAGVQPGDHIVKIGNELTENLTVGEAADRMRGDPGTSVILWIARTGETGLLRLPITRDNIRVPSVDSKLLTGKHGKVGYFKLKQFAATTSSEVASAMKDLRAEGSRGWIMDLRGNPGGLLEQAIQVSDLFLKTGTIVTTVSGKERESRRASRGGGTDAKLPVVVLINGNSASASEIVAGALKNLERSVTIGTTSFGKGSVQILYDNKDGSKLKLTIAEYLTPKDLSIQSVGIVPDIELFRMYIPGKNDDPKDYLRLKRSDQIRGEKDLKASLRSKYAKKPMKPDFELAYVYEKTPAAASDTTPPTEDGEDGEQAPDEEPDPDSEEIKVDFEIDLASELIRNAAASERVRMLKNARPILERRERAETQKLATSLATLGVDWAPSVSRPTASLAAKFEIEGHAGRLRAGETVKLTGSITNSGTGAAYRVHAKVRSESYMFNDAELAFGKIDAGQTKKWTTQLRIPDTALDGVTRLSFNVTGDGGVVATAQPLRFRVEAAARPIFAYAHQLIDLGNGDGLVQKGEDYKLVVTVKNTGAGTAKETTAIIRNASGDAIHLKKARFELGELKPGQTEKVEFEFGASRGGRANELVVELSVNDWHLREGVKEKLKYPINSAAAAPASVTGSIEVQSKVATIYEGASSESNTIATAPRGAAFNVTGQSGGWYRIEMPTGLPGFVHSAAARRGQKRPTPNRFKALWQVTPPKIALSIPSFEGPGSTYRLTGSITDDTHVEDLYVFVSNLEAKVSNRKVLYQSNRGNHTEGRLDFAKEIPLWPGSNMVTVVARENGEVQSSTTLYLYRTDGVGAAARASLHP